MIAKLKSKQRNHKYLISGIFCMLASLSGFVYFWIVLGERGLRADETSTSGYFTVFDTIIMVLTISSLIVSVIFLLHAFLQNTINQGATTKNSRAQVAAEDVLIQGEGRKVAYILVGLFFAGLVVATISTVMQQTAYTIVKDRVLVDSKWLDGAEVIDQRLEAAGVDSIVDLHVRVSPHSAKEMLSQNVIKECFTISENCTNPLWISYKDMREKFPAARPFVESGASTADVMCTSYWSQIMDDGSVNNQDIICIDPSSGDFWYNYFDV